MHSQQKTLAFALTATSSRRWALTLAGAVAFTAATAAAAHVRIPLPFSPVPVTMQTMVVLLAGATLGAAGGAASQLLYLTLGALGLPMFAAAPVTTGYLLGFVAAAVIVGAVARRTDRVLPVGLAMLAGSTVIYLFGATWLAFLFDLSPARALALGVLPYLPGDALKLAAALGTWRVGRAAWQRLVGGSHAS